MIGFVRSQSWRKASVLSESEVCVRNGAGVEAWRLAHTFPSITDGHSEQKM